MARPGASVVRGVFVFFIAQLKNSLPNFNVGLTATEPAVEANVDCVIADGAYYSIAQTEAWSTCGVLPVIPPP
ncbi:hypothetical protein, partial [Paraburkholderia sp. BR14427]